MIYITGDVHCPIDVKKLNTKMFPEQKKMTKDDFLIVCGDMGIVWSYPDKDGYCSDLYWQKWFKNKNFTTLFVDGNHENFDMLSTFPIVDFKGGKAHKISENVYHLMRGEIFEIDGISIFAFGGASSHDKEYRKEGESWWPEELPNKQEMDNGLKNLKNHNNRVNVIISHCLPTSVQEKVNGSNEYESDKLTDYFDTIRNLVDFDCWFSGHYHQDILVETPFVCVYNEILQLKKYLT